MKCTGAGAFSIRNPQSAIRNSFTLIELMVVIAIILILLGAVITVGRSVVGKGKERETAAILQKLDMASKEFESKKPLGKSKEYIDRYGDYPPDELDGFKDRRSSAAGIPQNPPGRGYIGPTDSKVIAPNNDLKLVANGDIKAFALALRLFSDKGAAILDEVASRYRKAAAKDSATGEVNEYLDRNDNNQFNPGVDEPLDYFVDAWGTPIGYFSTNDVRCTPSNYSDHASDWDVPPNVPLKGAKVWTSLRLLQLNNGMPVFVSYGADGPDQFSPDFSSTSSHEAKDLIWDYTANDDAFDKQKRFDNRFNQDNVYSHEGLREKIAAYTPPP